MEFKSSKTLVCMYVMTYNKVEPSHVHMNQGIRQLGDTTV